MCGYVSTKDLVYKPSQEGKILQFLIESKFERKTSKEKYDLQDSCVIFFTSKYNKPYSRFETKDQNNLLFGDGRHIVFINYNYCESIKKEHISSACVLLLCNVKQNKFTREIVNEIEQIISNS